VSVASHFGNALALGLSFTYDFLHMWVQVFGLLNSKEHFIEHFIFHYKLIIIDKISCTHGAFTYISIMHM
jgi:hypothetical protein